MSNKEIAKIVVGILIHFALYKSTSIFYKSFIKKGEYKAFKEILNNLNGYRGRTVMRLGSSDLMYDIRLTRDRLVFYPSYTHYDYELGYYYKYSRLTVNGEVDTVKFKDMIELISVASRYSFEEHFTRDYDARRNHADIDLYQLIKKNKVR